MALAFLIVNHCMILYLQIKLQARSLVVCYGGVDYPREFYEFEGCFWLGFLHRSSLERTGVHGIVLILGKIHVMVFLVFVCVSRLDVS